MCKLARDSREPDTRRRFYSDSLFQSLRSASLLPAATTITPPRQQLASPVHHSNSSRAAAPEEARATAAFTGAVKTQVRQMKVAVSSTSVLLRRTCKNGCVAISAQIHHITFPQRHRIVPWVFQGVSVPNCLFVQCFQRVSCAPSPWARFRGCRGI